MKLRMACVSLLSFSLIALASPIRVLTTKDIHFKYTACQMNGSDLDAYFGDQKKLSDGYLLHFKIKNFNELLKDHSTQNEIAVSSALSQVSLAFTDQEKWEKPEVCKGTAHLEPNGIYFSINCSDLVKTKGKKALEASEKLHLNIEKSDRLVCFPNN